MTPAAPHLRWLAARRSGRVQGGDLATLPAGVAERLSDLLAPFPEIRDELSAALHAMEHTRCPSGAASLSWAPFQRAAEALRRATALRPDLYDALSAALLCEAQ